MEDFFISLIIPTYNEEKRLGDTLRSVLTYFQKNKYAFEILVVDDGSKDKTAEVFQQVAAEYDLQKFSSLRFVKNSLNKGKGYVVKQGMLMARGKYNFFSDADLSTPIYEIEKLLKKLEKGVDIAFGSRALDRSLVRKHQPWFREIIGRFFNICVQVWVLYGIKDTQCGFKGFSREAATIVFSRQKLNSYIFDVEVLYIARKAGLAVVEIPVEWINHEDSRFRVNFKNFFTMWWDLFRIKFLH